MEKSVLKKIPDDILNLVYEIHSVHYNIFERKLIGARKELNERFCCKTCNCQITYNKNPNNRQCNECWWNYEEWKDNFNNVLNIYIQSYYCVDCKIKIRNGDNNYFTCWNDKNKCNKCYKKKKGCKKCNSELEYEEDEFCSIQCLEEYYEEG